MQFRRVAYGDRRGMETMSSTVTIAQCCLGSEAAAKLQLTRRSDISSLVAYSMIWLVGKYGLEKGDIQLSHN